MSYQRKVEKDRLNVIITTPTKKFYATIFLMKGHRLTDMLNMHNETFVPLTDVKAYCLITNHILFEKDFMVINKNIINDVILAE